MSQAVLQISSLSKRFGATHAVRDVSFEVQEGQIFGLLGPNGSGKTTTIACALGLLRPDGGSARVLGRPSRDIHRTAGRVGAVFDQDNLIPGLTVRANLNYAQRLLGHAGGRSPEEALALTGVADQARRRAGQLSLGQRKRVAVARALLGRPRLLILDEPLSALDPMGVRSMIELMRELAAEGVTLVLSSHRLHEMEDLITHGAVIARGSRIASGSLDQLLARERAVVRIHTLESDENSARALGILRAQEGVRACKRLAAAEDATALPNGRVVFEVEFAGVDNRDPGPLVSELLKALLDADWVVTAVIPERRSLPTLFHSLVDSNGAPLVARADREESRS